MTGLKKVKVIFIALGLVFIFAFLIFIKFHIFSFLPTWEQIFNSCGLYEVTDKLDNFAMSVHFLDVGKADAILIRCQDNNIVIDSGNFDPTRAVIQYLKRQGIESIDLLVASHHDRDHIGGMSDIINEFEVKKFMMPELTSELIPDSESYRNMVRSIKNRKVRLEYPEAGEDFYIGEMNIKILAPVEMNYESINNNSIVMQIKYLEDKFLFTGDAEQEEEYDILNKGYNLESTVLKVGHHGSRTSTTEEFLTAVNPAIAVISVGEDRNDLPKKDVVDRILNHNIELYRTDLNGIIIVASNGRGITIFTQK